MKMAAVTASTNKDSPKIDLAGVDAGEKMFVGLKAGVGSAKAVPAPQIQRSHAIRIRQLRGTLNCNLYPQSDEGFRAISEFKFLHRAITF